MISTLIVAGFALYTVFSVRSELKAIPAEAHSSTPIKVVKFLEVPLLILIGLFLFARINAAVTDTPLSAGLNLGLVLAVVGVFATRTVLTRLTKKRGLHSESVSAV